MEWKFSGTGCGFLLPGTIPCWPWQEPEKSDKDRIVGFSCFLWNTCNIPQFHNFWDFFFSPFKHVMMPAPFQTLFKSGMYDTMLLYASGCKRHDVSFSNTFQPHYLAAVIFWFQTFGILHQLLKYNVQTGDPLITLTAWVAKSHPY